jgi:hypothetical protein
MLLPIKDVREKPPRKRAGKHRTKFFLSGLEIEL